MSADKAAKKMVVVIQCDQAVRENCPGYLCSWAFDTRIDAFKDYPKEGVRYMATTCGGCTGRAVWRKLVNVRNNLKKRDQLTPDAVMVHLSTCITRSSVHGPRCPHIDYIKGQIERAGFDYVEDSRISQLAEKHRAEGRYDKLGQEPK